jgi:hypothetical protein
MLFSVDGEITDDPELLPDPFLLDKDPDESIIDDYLSEELLFYN